MAQVVSHRSFTRIGLGWFPDLCVFVCVGGGDLWCTKWNREGFEFDCLFLPQSVSFHKYSKLIFICIILLPERQTDEAWDLSKNSAVPEIGGNLIEKCFNFCLASKELKRNYHRI